MTSQWNLIRQTIYRTISSFPEGILAPMPWMRFNPHLNHQAWQSPQHVPPPITASAHPMAGSQPPGRLRGMAGEGIWELGGHTRTRLSNNPRHLGLRVYVCVCICACAFKEQGPCRVFESRHGTNIQNTDRIIRESRRHFCEQGPCGYD